MSDYKLRKRMTDEIEPYEWLDDYYERGDNNAKAFSIYREWLNSLSFSDFLDIYNQVREKSRNLD